MKLLNKANCAFVINTQSGAVKVKSGDIVEVTREEGEKLISCYPNAWKSLDVTIDKTVAVSAIVEDVKAVETVAVPCDEKASEKKKTNSKKKK